MAITSRDPAAELLIKRSGQMKGNINDSKNFELDIDPEAYTEALAKALTAFKKEQEAVERNKRERVLEDLQAASDIRKSGGEGRMSLQPLMQFTDALTGSRFAENYKAPRAAQEAGALADSIGKQGREGVGEIDALRMAGAKLPVDAATAQLRAAMSMDTSLANRLLQTVGALNKPATAPKPAASKPFEVGALNKLSGYKTVSETVNNALTQLVPLADSLGIKGKMASGTFLGPQGTEALGLVGDAASFMGLKKAGGSVRGWSDTKRQNALDVEKFTQMTELFKRQIMREIEGGRLSDADAVAYNQILGNTWSDPEAFFSILKQVGDDATRKYSNLHDIYSQSGRDPKELPSEIAAPSAQYSDTTQKPKAAKPKVKRSFEDLFKESKQK